MLLVLVLIHLVLVLLVLARVLVLERFELVLGLVTSTRKLGLVTLFSSPRLFGCSCCTTSRTLELSFCQPKDDHCAEKEPLLDDFQS